MMEAIKGVVRGNQRQSAQTTQYLMSKAIRFHRRQSEVLKRPFGVIRSSRGNSGSSEVLKRQSSGQQEALSDHQRRTLVASPEMEAAIKGVVRGNQGCRQRRTLVASPEMVAALRCPANASRAAVAYLMREAIEGVN